MDRNMENLEYNIKITGGFYIPEPLDTTKSVKIILEVDLYSAEKKDLQRDNEYLITYKGKAVGMPEVEQGDKKIRAVIRSKKSQAWRFAVMSAGKDYEEIMSKMLSCPDEVIEFVNNL